MNKTKIATTIAKLIFTALLLTITLAVTILIDGLKLVLEAVAFLNKDDAEEIICDFLLQDTPTIKLNLKPKWMLDLLPTEYLNLKTLKELAKKVNIKGYSRMPKAKLAGILSPAKSNPR